MSEPDSVFKLRKLPFVVLRKVFQYLGPVEILQFSMVSAVYRRTIISLRSHCLNNGYIGINNSSRLFHFEIWPKLGGPFRDFGHLKFREFEYPKLKKYETRSSFTLNGVKVILVFSSKKNYGTLYIPSETNKVLSVMQYFVETFGCVYYKIDVNLAYGNYWECGPLVEAVEFKTMSFHDCGPVSTRRPSNEELYKVFKNLKVSKKLEFEFIPQEPGFKFLPLFQSEIGKIVLYGDDYVTGEMILSMKAHEIDISDCLVTTEDIMAFITRWFNSEDRKFKKLELSGKAIGPLDLTAFNATKFEPMKRIMVGKEDWTTMECEIGYDIKRADGLVGSVLQDGTQFEFFVWQKKFIDKKRL
ncbi:hypothetical protein CRE_10735 [Caenorhabditis remanei]|uniref:F-box domain-containing protein n=1 Tax=Caenorhabditis remanei TaxID=31234 RepID=E3NQB7_CAERE|nr:hypothetical protein CRE_10735 [Caenorhabditis remanei]